MDRHCFHFNNHPSLFLLAAVISGAKRTETAGENLQAAEVANMGIERIKEEMEKDLQKLLDENRSMTSKEFISQVNQSFQNIHHRIILPVPGKKYRR